jgi:hypothetical protein
MKMEDKKFEDCKNCGDLNWTEYGLCDRCYERCKEAEEYVYKTKELDD